MLISYNWLKDYVDIKLPPDKLAEVLTMSGLAVDSIEKKNGDCILELEVTSNRPDWLSYIGIAREVAAITGRKFKLPVVEKRVKGQGARGQISVKVEDKKLCPRYTARIIRNIKVGESPEWLKKRREAAGLRPVNNIVDITNFCLFETGEPMHAFDLDKLGGSSIVVRKAAKGEKVIAIDGQERTLDDSMLVIADDKKPVAIAGIMGGLSTEVGISTKNILLEAAYFDPISVRRASRKLALSSESSCRFERKVDMENITYASGRALELICEIAGGEAGEFIDIGKTKSDNAAISLRYDRLNKITGACIPPLRAKKILTSLGLKVISSSKEALKLKAPKFRYDLQDEIDLVEEIARVYGYNNIPETIPPVVETGERLPFDMVVDKRVRGILTALGLSEIITYSLLSNKQLTLAEISGSDIIKIQNPLSIEQEIMRPTLLTGMLNSIRWNINRKTKDLRLFELGKIYLKENSFTEREYLSIGITGQKYDGWVGPARQVDMFDLKGITERLFLELGISGLSMKEADNSSYMSGSCAYLYIKGEAVGVLGEIDPKVSNNFDIKDRVYIAQLDCDKLTKHVSLEKYFKEPPRYPSIVRDISIVVDKKVFNEKITSIVKDAAGDILKDVQLIDRYRGGQVPDGKTSLTYRLEYQDLKRTLEDKDVSGAHSRIVRALEDNLGAKLR